VRRAWVAAALLPPLFAAAADKPLWEAGFGAGGVNLPHYRGSNQSNAWLLPVPYFVYRGAILRADRDGARAVLFDSDRVDFDVSLAASAPAKSTDDPARKDMPDLAPTLELGPKLNVNLVREPAWKIDFRMPLRWGTTLQGSPRSIGWSLTPVLNLDWRPGSLNVGLQAGPLWGDRRQHAYFYDVAPEYATATRPAYRASGGYAGWQATLGLSRRWGDFWFGAFARTDSVAGAVFDSSPLVTSRRQWSYGLATAWVFATSQTRVSVED
jgi:outer membrane scaffolding protein for murein synthesis (MipA/OmpV family)